jgi:hypothetical protein
MYNAKQQKQGGSTLCMHIFINVTGVIPAESRRLLLLQT